MTKIVVAQVYLLLSTIKEEKEDTAKWDSKGAQLQKLINENGMEVFSKYFTRLVAGNVSQIFPSLNRPVTGSGNYHILAAEMRKIAHEPDQASKIAESVESGTEDIFRDFDLSTFMEHFKLDALEKSLLALAFKTGSRSDLKTKGENHFNHQRDKCVVGIEFTLTRTPPWYLQQPTLFCRQIFLHFWTLFRVLKLRHTRTCLQPLWP